MNRCENCKHWGAETVTWMPPGSKPCGIIHPRAENGMAALDNPSFASEDAVLYTSPGFGCVLFEAKGGYEPEPESEEGVSARSEAPSAGAQRGALHG